MKQFVYGIAILGMTGAFAATPVETQVSMNGDWKADAAVPGTYSINYSGREWPGVSASFPVKGGTFYKVTFEGRADEPKQKFILTVPDNVFEFEAANDFTPCTLYFYANEDAPAKRARVYLNPEPGATKAQIRNFKVETISGEDLAENLFPNGDFEAGVNPRGVFVRGWQNPEFCGEVVSSPNFLCGAKSLALRPSQGKNIALYSIRLPAIPKRKIELKFWAKADSPQALSTSLDFWQQGQKKHLYDSRKNKLTAEWKEYTHSFEVPAEEEYPTLRTRTMRIVFQRDNVPGNIYLDNIEYRILK